MMRGGFHIDEARLQIQPYIKNKDIFYCPSRSDKGCDLGIIGGASQTDRCWGIGYNFGPALFTDNSGGLYTAIQFSSNGDIYHPGKALAAFAATADTFAFGDSGSYVLYDLSANTILRRSAANSNGGLVHGGRYNMSYVDGHAKNMGWRAAKVSNFLNGYFVPSGRVAAPRNQADWSKWCADPNQVMIIGGSKTLPCGQVAADMLNGVQWFTD